MPRPTPPGEPSHVARLTRISTANTGAGFPLSSPSSRLRVRDPTGEADLRRSNRLAALLMPELDQAEPEPEPEPSPERAWGKPAAAEEQHAWYHVDHRNSPPSPQPEPEPLWESPEQESPLGGNSPLEAEEEYLRALQQQEMEEVGDEGSALQRAAEAVAGLVRRAVEDPAYYGTGAGEMTVDGVRARASALPAVC